MHLEFQMTLKMDSTYSTLTPCGLQELWDSIAVTPDGVQIVVNILLFIYVEKKMSHPGFKPSSTESRYLRVLKPLHQLPINTYTQYRIK